MVLNGLKQTDVKYPSFGEKLSKVKRLKNGQICWVKIFEKQGTWTVEMSGLSSHLQDMKHSYVFSKNFEIDQVISESECMYVDFVEKHQN